MIFNEIVMRVKTTVRTIKNFDINARTDNMETSSNDTGNNKNNSNGTMKNISRNAFIRKNEKRIS